MKNKITVEVNGEKRHFKFGIGVYKILEFELQMPLNNFKDHNDLVVVPKLLYAAAVNYCRIKGKPQDFTEENVCQWIDDMEQDDLNAIMTTWVRTNTLGFSVAKVLEEDLKKKLGGKNSRGSKRQKGKKNSATGPSSTSASTT